MAKKLKRSKRYGLNSLPLDWREQIFSTILSKRLKLAVAVLGVTGCRPVELEQGVRIRIVKGNLVIKILGAKVDLATGRGQPVRHLIVDNTTQSGMYLFNHLKNIPSHAADIKYDAGAVSERLREKSRKLWPRRKYLVSAYTYRHYIGKSLKEAGETVQKIACTLGHASDFSQTVYGRAGGAKRSAGGHGIIHASASNDVRHSAKSDRLNRFTQNKAPKND